MRANIFILRLLAGLIGAVAWIVVGLVATLFVSTALMDGEAGFGLLATITVAPWVIGASAIIGVVAGLLVLRYRRSDKWRDSTNRRKIFLTTALTLGPIVLTAAMVWRTLDMADPPSDHALMRQFQRHRATLDRIVQMAHVDKGLDRVDCNWTQPDNPQSIGISSARIAEYRRFLDRADVHRGFQTGDSAGEIDFYYWLQGSAMSSDYEKGFAYLATPPTRTLASLDGLNPNGENAVTAYRHITGHWYLFYEYMPD